LLEHHAAIRSRLGDGDVIDGAHTARRRDVAGDAIQQRGLAAAGRPQDADEFTRRNVERGFRDRGLHVLAAAKGHRNPVDHDMPDFGWQARTRGEDRRRSVDRRPVSKLEYLRDHDSL
jgi:hypothetical protein